MKLISNLFLLLAVGILQVSCLKIPMAIDAAPSASDTQDLTVLMSGCQSKPTAGYLFCKVQEKADPRQINIRLYAPSDTCQRDSCFKYQFIRKDGTLGLVGAIPRGKGSVELRLSEIIESTNQIDDSKAGEYQVMIRLWWVDQVEKIERTSRADGLIRVWVVKEEFAAMACNDPQTGWKIGMNKSCRADISTRLRVALCGDGCER